MPYDVVVIGAGPAGLAAAAAAEKAGAKDVLLIERDNRLGGILPQCIHNGFGLHRFGEELTGPEYASRDIDALQDSSITLSCSTFVTDMHQADGMIHLQLVRRGEITIQSSRAVVLAMGCRERTAGAISLPGTRPAGIFTAGTAQRLMNLQNIFLGKEAVIIGSGDIGLIMARRLTLEGAHVNAVTEMNSFPGGLNRNIHQCLEDFDIPLYLSTQVTQVFGSRRVEGVTIAGEQGSHDIPCDTLLLSVGLIPENELSRKAGIQLDKNTQGAVVDQYGMTSAEGIFSCGNVLHVHDVADFVTEEAVRAGEHAARWANNDLHMGDQSIEVAYSEEIAYVLPQKITQLTPVLLSLRIKKPQSNCRIKVIQGKRVAAEQRFIRLVPSEMVRLPVTVEPSEPVEVICE